jgi:hypothetical protein
MIEVRVDVDSVPEALDIVDSLRRQGLVQGTDFDFEYHKPTYDDYSSPVENRFVIFKFHSERYATLFTLKYVK